MNLDEYEKYLNSNYGETIRIIQEELKKDKSNSIEDIEHYTNMATDILEIALNNIEKLKKERM